MSKQECKTCLFGDICSSELECEYFISIDENNGDEMEQYIENKRQEYLEEWWRYLDRDSEMFFCIQNIN